MKTLFLIMIILFSIFNNVFCFADQYFSSPFNSVDDIAVEGDLLWCATSGGAVQWNKITGDYVTYTLPTNGIYSGSLRYVEVDSNGVKWFGSNNGLVTYDGETWNTILENVINDIFIDNKNGVWFSTDSLRKIDAETGNEVFFESSGVTIGGIRCCAEADDGTMWYGSENGVWQFDGNVWTNYTFDDIWSNSVKDIAVDKSGFIWITTNGGGIWSYDLEEWTRHNDENPQLKSHNYSICIDSNDVKWFVPGSRGLTSYDNTTWVSHDMNNYKFNTIICDNDIIWGSTYENGIIGFNDSLWINHLIPLEKIQNIFTCAAVDSNNTKWFGSDGYGIYSIDRDGIINSYSTDRGLPEDYTNTITSTLIDENGYVVAKSEDGRCVRFNGELWELLDDCNSLEFPDQSELILGNEEWTVEDHKLTRTIDGDATTYYANCQTSVLAVDNRGNIWFSSSPLGNVSYFDGFGWTSYQFVRGKDVKAITVDKDNTVWFCTEGDGIWSYNGAQWEQYTMNGEGLSTLSGTDCNETTDGYFPMSVGNNWRYKRTSTYGWEGYEFSDDLILTIVGTSELDGQTNFRFLDGKLMRLGEDGNIYRDGSLYYDFSPSEGPLNYEVPGNYVLRETFSCDVPIGACAGYDFHIYFWEHGYREMLSQNLGLVYYKSSTDIGYSIVYELCEAYINGVEITEWTTDIKGEITLENIVLNNYPNPFNPSTTISYNLPKSANITISIYNTSGQRVSVLKDKYQQAGSYSTTWTAQGFPTGLYFCTVEADGFRETRKMMLVK